MNYNQLSHHMLREIMDEPKVVEATLRQNEREVKRIVEKVISKDYDLIYLTGSGTSYHAGLSCQYALFNFEATISSLIPASEFPLWIPNTINRNSLLVAISQSGESVDVLKAANTALDKGVDLLVITNNQDSTLASIGQYTLLTCAGKEFAVTATKSYIAQLAILFLFSLELAEERMQNDMFEFLRRELFQTPKLIEGAIESSIDAVFHIAEEYKFRNFFFALGSGPRYATALETALKLKEACNIFAEGLASREFLHGPIQLINEKTPVIMILSSVETVNLMNLIERVIGFNAPLISVSDNSEDLIKVSTHTVSVPKGFPNVFSPILYVVPLQLFAYYSSVARGLNPDKPEKLTKVVTK